MVVKKEKKVQVKWVNKIKISSLRNKKKRENLERGRAKLLKRISDKNEGTDQNKQFSKLRNDGKSQVKISELN